MGEVFVKYRNGVSVEPCEEGEWGGGSCSLRVRQGSGEHRVPMAQGRQISESPGNTPASCIQGWDREAPGPRPR